MDKAVISESMRDLEHDFEFKSKNMQYISDTNYSGTYNSGQVTLDLSALAGNTSYVNFKEANILIPLVMNLTGSGHLTADVANAFALSLKNGYWNILDSYNVSINGISRKETVRYENQYISYRVNSTFSQDDLNNMGPSIGFQKDNGFATYYSSGVATNYGLGETHNVSLDSTLATDTTKSGYNGGTNVFANGRFRRMQTTSMNLNTTSFASIVKNSETLLQNENRNYCHGANSANEVIYYVTAVIPLKLFSIFESLPLMRGARIVLNLFTNSNCSCSFQTIGGGTIGFSQTGFSITSQTGQFPMQISAPCYNTVGNNTTGFNSITTANATFVCGIAIARSHSSASAVFTHTISNVRLYYPLYLPSDTLAMKLTDGGGMLKNVVYKDLQSSILTNVMPNSAFTYVFPAILPKVRSLLIIPFISALVNGGTSMTTTLTNAVIVGSPVISPFVSGTTCSPYLTVTNFNVSLNAKMLYQQPRSYNWEAFNNEVRPSNMINGGITNYGLSNGLISEEDWNSKGYNYIYVDLSRHTQAEDMQATQISITGQNNTNIQVDYYVFVEYEKSFVINCSTGQISQ